MSQRSGAEDGGGPAATAAPGSVVPATLAPAMLAPPVLGCPEVRRPRLLFQLSRAVARTPLTLLTGPAGCGKTVLASSWARAQADPHVAWLTVDELNDGPATFWPALLAAVSQAGAETAGPPVPAWEEPVPRHGASTLAWQLRELSTPIVVVMDNADRLNSPDLLGELDQLLLHASGRLRLVACGRAAPSLPFHRDRGAEAATEIDADALAFTPEETGQLLASLGAPVPAATAEALAARTEGWAAALHLAAAPVKKGLLVEQLLDWLTADDGTVAEYLFAEVLDRQPATTRRFLLRASVTEELWPDLVTRLTGRADADRVLTALAASNAFVEKSAAVPGGYRMHGLFRELLADQLAYEAPRAFAAAHRTCATWYGDAGRPRQAVEHAAVTGDWATVASRQIDDLAVGRLLTGQTDHLPLIPTVPAGPEAAVLRTAAALARGSALDQQDLALTASAARGSSTGAALRASAAAVCAAATAAGPVPDPVLAVAARAEAEVSSLPPEHQRDKLGLAVVITAARAAGLLRTDADDQTLLDAHRAALAECQAADAPRPTASCLGDLALLEAVRGRLVRAESLVGSHQALGVDGWLPEREGSAAAAIAAAWIWIERAEYGRARRWLARAGTSRRRPDLLEPLRAVLLSRMRRNTRDLNGALAALPTAVRDTGAPRWIREQVLAEEVRIRFARGQGREGMALLDRFPAASPWPLLLRATAGTLGLADAVPAPTTVGIEHSLSYAVQAGIIRASSHADRGDLPNAVAELEAAVRLAEPELLRRPFGDAPRQVRRLLRTESRLAAASDWLNPTAVPVPAPPPPPDTIVRPAAPVIVKLSEREMEVLRHLDRMHSTAELAAEMYISVNTARTHIRAILRKLSASRRTDALRYARQLQII